MRFGEKGGAAAVRFGAKGGAAAVGFGMGGGAAAASSGARGGTAGEGIVAGACCSRKWLPAAWSHSGGHCLVSPAGRGNGR